MQRLLLYIVATLGMSSCLLPNDLDVGSQTQSVYSRRTQPDDVGAKGVMRIGNCTLTMYHVRVGMTSANCVTESITSPTPTPTQQRELASLTVHRDDGKSFTPSKVLVHALYDRSKSYGEILKYNIALVQFDSPVVEPQDTIAIADALPNDRQIQFIGFGIAGHVDTRAVEYIFSGRPFSQDSANALAPRYGGAESDTWKLIESLREANTEREGSLEVGSTLRVIQDGIANLTRTDPANRKRIGRNALVTPEYGALTTVTDILQEDIASAEAFQATKFYIPQEVRFEESMAAVTIGDTGGPLMNLEGKLLGLAVGRLVDAETRRHKSYFLDLVAMVQGSDQFFATARSSGWRIPGDDPSSEAPGFDIPIGSAKGAIVSVNTNDKAIKLRVATGDADFVVACPANGELCLQDPSGVCDLSSDIGVKLASFVPQLPNGGQPPADAIPQFEGQVEYLESLSEINMTLFSCKKQNPADAAEPVSRTLIRVKRG